jgi:hypothetical protein
MYGIVAFFIAWLVVGITLVPALCACAAWGRR